MSDRSGIWGHLFKKKTCSILQKHIMHFWFVECCFLYHLSKKGPLHFRFQTAYVVLMIVVFFGFSVSFTNETKCNFLFWIFWHVWISWLFLTLVFSCRGLTKNEFGKASCFQTFYSSCFIKLRYFYFEKTAVFCLIKLRGKDRLVSKLFCAYYIVQVCFVSASILFWNVSDQRLTTFGWFNIGSGNFNVS